MVRKHAFLWQISLLIVSICLLFVSINMFNLNKQVKLKGYGYYIGKIESMNQKENITTMQISPISSNREFISEIKANHKIEYLADRVAVAGIKDPKIKNYRRLKMGELREMANNIKVGDKVIFKVKNNDYQKSEYNLQIDGLAFDMTLE